MFNHSTSSMKKYIPSLVFFSLFLATCSPVQDPDISLPPLPGPPQISVEPVSGDPNRVIVRDLSTGFFSRTWDFPGGAPAKSTLAVDTVFYAKKGNYTITLYAAVEGGGGTSQSAQTVAIAEDATVACDPQTGLLTGDCGPAGKCWTFTTAAGAVRVGPVPGDWQWYTSPVNGLQGAQYDDSFCFYIDGARFVYDNKGTTVDPWNGYAVVNYTPPNDYTWFISKGTGTNGADQIVLPDGAFLGVWDSGPVYDILSLTADQLVVQSKIVNTDGWFQLTFVKR